MSTKQGIKSTEKHIKRSTIKQLNSKFDVILTVHRR